MKWNLFSFNSRVHANRAGVAALALMISLLAACVPAPVVPPSPAGPTLSPLTVSPAPLATAEPTEVLAMASTSDPPTAAPATSTAPSTAVPSATTAPAVTAVPTAVHAAPSPTLAGPALAFSPTPFPRPTPTVSAKSRATAPPPALSTAGVPSPTPNTGAGGEVAALLVAPGEPGRLYALVKEGAGPLWAFPSSAVRLMISDNYAVNWAPFPGGLPVAPECMININLDYAVYEGLWASTCSGLYVWQPTGWVKRSDRVVDVVAVVYRPGASQSPAGKELWAAEHGKGVIHSTDGGQTWQDASAGLVTFGGLANLGIDPRDNATLYGIIRPKYAGSYLRRLAGGGQWQTMPTPENNITIEPGMALDGETGALYITSQIAPYRLWRSPNPNAVDPNQVTWQPVHDFGQDRQVDLLASGWSPQAPQNMALYANVWPLTPLPGGGAGVGQAGFYRSADGGQTWQPLDIP